MPPLLPDTAPARGRDAAADSVGISRGNSVGKLDISEHIFRDSPT